MTKTTQYLCVALLSFTTSLGLFLPPPSASAAEPQTVPVYFFWGSGCPHCAKEFEALTALRSTYPTMVIHGFEVYSSQANAELLGSVASTIGFQISGVPVAVIGDQVYIGFAEGTTDVSMGERIRACLDGTCPDSVRPILDEATTPSSPVVPAQAARLPDGQGTPPPVIQAPTTETKRVGTVDLPFLGTVDLSSYSLPAITVILAALDGFNPCAMWTLVFLIGLLLGVKSSTRRWILGSTFLLASAGVYYLFLAAWLNIMIFLGFLWWIRSVIGVVALSGGAYALWSVATGATNTCKVTADPRRKWTMERIKIFVQERSFPLAIAGIAALAVLVNLVELVCSAGLPAVFTQILALNDLSTWGYHLYLLLYIAIFLLDDLIVFGVAMVTLQLTGVTTKYVRVSRIIGGFVMLAIGLALIFRPAWLAMG
ncbi:MAG: hypothetical protein V1745_03140 [Patescibacteria group bacterium]